MVSSIVLAGCVKGELGWIYFAVVLIWASFWGRESFSISGWYVFLIILGELVSSVLVFIGVWVWIVL